MREGRGREDGKGFWRGWREKRALEKPAGTESGQPGEGQVQGKG